MKTEKKIFIILAVSLAVVFFPSFLLAVQKDLCKPSKAEVIQKVQKLQIPFVANNGQIDERVKFYANTFGGTVFITKDGEIVYSLPGKDMGQEASVKGFGSDFEKANYAPRVRKDGILSTSEILDLFLISCGNPISKIISSNFVDSNPESEIKSVALKEEFVGGKISEIKGEEKAVTNVNYFKGKDPSKWKTNISTYEVVSLGEIYDGIELKLKAYGNNVEKLFCVKLGADPDQIKIRLSGVKDCGVQNAECGIENPKLQINKSGELEVETELGTVKFTKPVAYQEIDGKRVNVTVEYNLLNLKSAIQSSKSVYGFKVASYDRTKDLIIDPLLASTYLGGSSGDGGYSIAIDSSENIYVAGWTSSSDFPTTTGAYDTSYFNGGYDNDGDAFVSKLSGDLTSLLASTFLGGVGPAWDYGQSLAIDSSGNVYVAGYTQASDFPTTTGAYNTFFNGGAGDAFVSKLNGDLTNLLASTLLGGYYSDGCNFIAIDSGGNVYLTGWTYSSDFPTTTGAYDTSFNGGYYDTYGDAFVSKLSGDLTSLLSSTFLGGADSGGSDSWDYGQSIAIDSGGNVYVAGYTQASDFPTTSGAYDTFFNGGYGDAFVSKLNGDLTSLHASTFLGGSSWDRCYSSIAIDSSGNIYVSGVTDSLDFPTTISAYDTFFNGGYSDVFVSKLNSDLTSLLASTFLGGDYSDGCNFIAIDSGGNIYLTGYTYSSKFPTTTGAYDTSYNGRGNAFVSKLNGDLANLLSSTFLGLYAAGISIAINSDGNIYVAGGSRSDFPTTTGAYDTSYNDGGDVFVSKFDSNLSASPPSVTTGSATNVTSSSATLNGIVNANGLSTTVWFQYDTVSGSYTNTSSKHTVTGTSDTTVSTSISGLSSGTTYYYRITAQNSVGTAYGSELSFTTVTPTPSPTATPTQPPTVTTSPATNVTTSSATLNGTVNAHGLTTTAEFEYGTSIGTYSNTSSTQTVNGTTDTSVSINISGLTGGTTYYYRIAARNSAGISYGSELSFTTVTPTPTPTPTISPCTDSYEPNDSFSTAYGPLISGSSYSGKICSPSDVDYFKITVDNPVAISLTLDVPSNKDYDLNLYNSSQSLIANSTAAAGITETITYGTSTTGVYYIQVIGYFGAYDVSQTYALSGTWAATPTPSPSPPNGVIFGVINDQDNIPLKGVIVTITSSGISGSTITDENGFYTFRGLPAGDYILTYEKEGYITKTQNITLKEGETLDLGIIVITMEISKSNIFGSVVDAKGNPIESVRLKLTGVKTSISKTSSSDADGFFKFLDLEADTYVIFAKKKAYKRYKQTVKLGENEDKEIEIVMKKIRKKSGMPLGH